MESNSTGEIKFSPSSPEKTKTTLNILVVDDEPSIRELLPLYIERSSVASQIGILETAADGQEALDKILQNKGRYNVVVTDGQMPRMNGLDLNKKIKESGEAIVVGLVSGGLNGLDMGDAATQESMRKDHGIAAVLPKPFAPKQISTFMNQIKDAVDLNNQK